MQIGDVVVLPPIPRTGRWQSIRVIVTKVLEHTVFITLPNGDFGIWYKDRVAKIGKDHVE
jgi:hypothetical protein